MLWSLFKFVLFIAAIALLAVGAGYLMEAIPTRTTAEWMEALDAVGVPAMPVIRIEGLLEDEHLNAVGLVERVEHPSEGPIWLAGRTTAKGLAAVSVFEVGLFSIIPSG